MQGTEEQADNHYRAVIRAFVHEALELTQFLEKVAGERFQTNTRNFQNSPGAKYATASSQQLETLGFDDWVSSLIK